MNKLFMLIAFCLWAGALAAFPAHIQSWDITHDVEVINKLQISIDQVNHRTGAITVYLRDDNEFQLLQANGYDPVRMPDDARDYYLELLESTRNSDNPLSQYYNIDEYISFMQNVANTYPAICQLVQYGTSIQGRPLYALKISDSVQVNEAEPEVKLIGSIHGDETVGYDMLIRTINLMCQSYGTDPRITSIVDNTELWISPLMNPDGYELGQRYNAAGVDLNRNFPMPTGITNPDGNPTAVENLAMISFSQAHNFAIGINFHGGALVLNYPWDYTYTLSPDNDLVIDMSLTYSMHNSPMYNSDEFDQGITNGAAWYIITGSMQDWNYAFTSNIELTAEISNVKWPAASTLDGYWDDNRESILSFIEYAQKGIRGRVMSNATVPLAATIEVGSEGKVIHTDPTQGDYQRVLMPGTYTVTAKAEGHLHQSVELVVPATGNVTHDFWLEAAQQVDFTGVVRDMEGYPIASASVLINTSSPATTVTNADGSFSFADIYEGNYQLQINAPGYAMYTSEIQLRAGDLGTHAVIVLGEGLFSDDFEADLSAWITTGSWGRSEVDGSWVLTDSPSGNYSSNQNRAVRLSSPISLVGVQNPSLSFRAKWDLEAGYDFVYVEGSSDGSNWIEIGSFTGSQDTWANQVFTLSAFAGSPFHLRFRLRSDWSQNADGIYIDNVLISGQDTSLTLFGDANGDGIIDMSDTQAILEHTVGNSVIPNLQASDLDLQTGVTALDAYMVYLYVSNPSFRFPVQSGTAYSLSEIAITNHLEDATLSLSFENSNALHSFYVDAPFAIDWVSIDTASNWIQALNAAEGRFAMIGYDFCPTHTLGLIDPSNSFNIPAQINGYDSLIRVNPSAQDDPHSPEISLSLAQNHPNPFNPNTTVAFYLPQPGLSTLQIFNLKGQLVKTLVQGDLTAGDHQITWDGRDSSGMDVSSGIYFYRLKSSGKSLERKMVLSK
jgi:hypothetical protein